MSDDAPPRVWGVGISLPARLEEHLGRCREREAWTRAFANNFPAEALALLCPGAARAGKADAAQPDFG